MDSSAATLTLAVACVFSVLVLVLPPAHALTAFLASVIWYPSYYSAPLGTLNWTVPRIVVLALLAKALLDAEMKNAFKLSRLDKSLIAVFACETVSGVTTAQDVAVFLQYQSGQIFDMVLPYFVVRLIMVKREYYLTLLRGILLISAPFAVLAFYQFWTAGNPFSFIRTYIPKERKGRFRAELTFEVSIMLGLYFASLGSACVGLLRAAVNNKWVYVVAMVLMGIGVISSDSSGPILALVLAVMFLCFYRWRHEWRLATVIVVLMCGVVEIISNRHFYDVLGDYTLSPETAWYRSRLMQVALFDGGMSGHWLLGFGTVDPGWGPQIDGRGHTDIVNHFILILSIYGLVGLMPFLWMCWETAKTLLSALRRAVTDEDRWLVWSLAAALFGMAGAFFSVSLFGPPTTTFYMLIAFSGAMPALVAEAYPKPRLTAGLRRTRSPEPMLMQ
jgi:hypothetical protein